eukprot:12094655-Heterocapsa_arctica.AAC.1
MFVQVLRGRALTLLRIVPKSNEFEAWRMLVREYEPETPLRYAAMLRALMKPVFTEGGFREEWMAWERQVQEYDRTTGRPMEGCMKIAAV